MLNYITNQDIQNLPIQFSDANKWIEKSFSIKNNASLPAKTSIAFGQDGFFNTMPIIIPDLNIMGVKLISRYHDRTPTIDGHIIVYDFQTGELTHILDAGFITSLRTGAVCATAVKYLAKKQDIFAFIGLGNTAKMSLKCILANITHKITVKLFKYKEQHISFINEFSNYDNVSFNVVDNMKDLCNNSDVVISCITYTNELLTEPEWFKDSALLIPVHTRGFQNCDTVFDKIIADDINHISHFKYFNQYKFTAELADVILGKLSLNQTNERIIAYNIGIALHDLYFAKHIIDMNENN